MYIRQHLCKCLTKWLRHTMYTHRISNWMRGEKATHTHKSIMNPISITFNFTTEWTRDFNSINCSVPNSIISHPVTYISISFKFYAYKKVRSHKKSLKVNTEMCACCEGVQSAEHEWKKAKKFEVWERRQKKKRI